MSLPLSITIKMMIYAGNTGYALKYFHLRCFVMFRCVILVSRSILRYGNRGHNQPATLISTGRCYMTSQVILTALLLESRKCSLVMLFPCRRTMVMQSVDLTFRRAGKSFSSMRTTIQTRASSTPGRSTHPP